MTPVQLALAVLAAYLVGSIPAAYLAGKAKGVDLRQHGSGNLGATNAWRVLGWRIGLAVYLFDTLKGALPVLLLPAPSADTELWKIAYGIAAIAGHVRPIYLGGKVRYVQRPANVSPFTAPPPAPAAEPARAETTAIVVKSKSAPVAKIDPAFIAANRELRDRYLEHLNADPSVLPALGKYNAVRALPGPTVVERRAIAPAPARALPEAA